MTGESEVDESLMTGEATLVHKRPGDSVIAGSVNHAGTLIAQVTRLPCENTIRAIGAMVHEAKLCKPRVQKLADRVASYFVPVILGTDSSRICGMDGSWKSYPPPKLRSQLF